MALAVSSVIRRHMKRTGRYFEPGASGGAPDIFGLPSDESILGWYRNPEPWERYWILFTDKAIYSSDEGRIERIQLTEILDYEFPKSKIDVTGVRVRTRDGFRFLRASGSLGPEGSQKDAFSLIMVLGVLAGQNRK